MSDHPPSTPDPLSELHDLADAYKRAPGDAAEGRHPWEVCTYRYRLVLRFCVRTGVPYEPPPPERHWGVPSERHRGYPSWDWLYALEDWRTKCVIWLGEREPPPPPPPKRLTVDLACRTITLDNVKYDVGSVDALRWVRVLADHPGEWISGTDLERYDPDLLSHRTDRWVDDLPSAISRLIESRRGAGSRIRLA